MAEVLLYLSLIIGISAILTVLARLIKQPPIIAYLLSGILVGPLILNWIGPNSPSSGMLQTFAHIGVALLLFIVGMSLDMRLLREVGKVSAIVGAVEMLVVGLIGFLVSLLFGFSNITAMYIGIAIAFSSTVVVVKILSDKKELNTLHGRISIGILIVQDIVASILLMVLPFFNYGGSINVIFKQILIVIIILSSIFALSALVLNRFLNYLAKSQETLFLFAIAWALVLSAIFNKFGFSIEIGALIAGISLASTKYTLDLESRIKPLRDFFVVLFFVFFGSQLSGPIGWNIIIYASILSLLVLLIKPLVVMITLKFLGYAKRTNFLTSVSLAQVSEFSLIIILLGFTLGHINQEIMNLSILVALITIGISTYSITASAQISDKISKFLDFFEGKRKKENTSNKKEYEIILLGYHRMGYKLLESLKNLGMSLLVIDYNPKVVLDLNKQNIDAVFGDAANSDFLNEIELTKAKMIISTIPEESSNLNILQTLKENKSKAVFIAVAEQPRIAMDLYEAGADYILIPHHLSGEYASVIIKQFKNNKDKYKKIGDEHFKHLKKAKRNSNFDN